MSSGGRRRRRDGPARRGGDPARAGPSSCRCISRARLSPVELVSADELESIHDASLTILEEIGIDVLLPEAREILAPPGPGSSGQRVRSDRGHGPRRGGQGAERFTLHARNPAHSVEIGGDSIMFCAGRQRAQLLRPRARPAAGQPRRLPQLPASSARRSTSCTSPAAIRSSRSTCTPRLRHLECLRDIDHADRQAVPRLFAGQGAHPRRHRDAPASRAASTREQLEREPSLFTIINTNSPLRLDAPMAAGHHRDGAAPARSWSDAVHAGGRHGAGDGGRRAGAAECRGAGRHRADPARAPGRAGGLWRLHLATST